MPPQHNITPAGRYIILAAAFLGWMFSGFQMAVMTLTARSATTEFLRRGVVTADAPLRISRLAERLNSSKPLLDPAADEGEALKQIVPRWFSWYNAAFLFGAASGG